MAIRGWLKKLFREIDIWVEDKIIEPSEADKIKARYSKQSEYNKLASSIFILGSILVGLGIILFIASNWQQLGKTIKVALIFSLILGFNLLGYYFRFEKKNFPKLGEALLFLGAICFGAGIWLIAQIFQISYNYANGLLFWILGILPIIFLLRSETILVLSSILLPVWLSVIIANNPSQAVYPFFLLLALIIYLTYREKQKASLFISIISTSIWLVHYLYVRLGEVHHFSISLQLLYTNMLIAYGFILYCLGMLHDRNKKFCGFAIIYKLFAIIFILINNYSLTFVHHYNKLSYVTKSPDATYLPLTALIIYIFYFFGGIISLNYVLKLGNPEKSREAKVILPFLILQVIYMHLGALGGVFISVAYNILLFVEIIAFLYLGYLLREEFIFRLSLYIFALDILTRYFDTFWKILPRSMFFIIGGLILLLGGIYMEKQRRTIEKKMKDRLLEAETV